MTMREDTLTRHPFEDDETLVLQSASALMGQVAPPTRPSSAQWTLELRLQDVAAPPISLLITGDTVLGRETLDASPDFDLTPLGGWIGGVSRHHVLLRATPNHVYVIDLQSSRGTYHNGVQLSSTVASQLRNNDTLQFGQLSFRVKLERAAFH
jgi:hypothetical protein